MHAQERVAGPAQEAEWLRQVAAGDRGAFEQLYAAYAQRVFRFVVRMVRDEARAEEVTNDVMVEIWKSAKRFEGRSAPSTWIFGIAHHRTLNALRGKKLATTSIDEAVDVADEREDSEVSIGRKALKTKLKEAMATLSPEHREVLELTFYQGYSYQEIAEIVGCPANTVKTRMFHAKRRLQPLLAEAGIAGDSL